MTSIVPQDSSLGSCPTSPSLNPHHNQPFGHWPCVKSCLVGGSDKYCRALVQNRYTRSRIDLKPYGSQLRLGHLWVGDDVIDSIVLHRTSWSSLNYNQASVLGLLFGSMFCKAHQAHIALSGQMISIVQSFDRVSSPVWCEAETNIHIPAETAGGRGRLSVPPLVIALWPRSYQQQQQQPETHSSRRTQQPMSWLQPADDAGTNHNRRLSTANQTNHSCFSHSNSSSQN